MQFGILGAATVRSTEGDLLSATRPRQRNALCILLLNNGRPISRKYFIDALWGIDPPSDPGGALRSNIYSLRKSLGINGRLQTGHNSYTLTLHENDLLDLHHFLHLVRQAQKAQLSGDLAGTALLLERALGTWGDPPLLDIPRTPTMQPLISELLERRNAAQEALMDARLALGEHRDLLPSLMSLTTAEPLRERRWEQLMLALYRCGRQAEALDTFARARGFLTEQYGLDPGVPLKELQQRILAGDPALDHAPPVPARPDGPLVPPQRGPHFAEETAPRPPVAVPHQLPSAPRTFIGREAELNVLSDLAGGVSPAGSCPVVSVICGAPGTGKTALALHFAHQVADRFPDGQLYVDLGAFGPSADGVDSRQAIRSVLDTMIGLPRGAYSQDTEAGWYRTVLADRRMLILIDNAADSAQVHSLLPAAPQCMVIITSRVKLTDLITSHSAHLTTLDALPPAQARNLLASRLAANNLAVDDDAVTDMSESCARLPLALVLAAARAAARPVVPLSELAAELRGRPNGLNALGGTHSRTDLRTVFSWSYERLTGAEADMFRALGAHRARDVSVADASRLAGVPTAQAMWALTGLANTHLIKEYAPGRYRFDELIGAYATEKAGETAALHGD